MAKLISITEIYCKNNKIYDFLRELASYNYDFTDYIIYFNEEEGSPIEVNINLLEVLKKLLIEIKEDVEHEFFADIEKVEELIELLNDLKHMKKTFFICTSSED